MEEMVKDPSITQVVDRLRALFGVGALDTVDYWDGDRCAIGVVSPHAPGRLVYICTHGKPPERFYVSLELPPTPGSDLPYADAGDRDELDFDGLVVVLGQHLHLQ